MHVRKVRIDSKIMEEAKWSRFLENLKSELQKKGFSFLYTEKTPRQSLDFHDIRLSADWIKSHGHTVSPYTGRRGNILGWNDWVRFNGTVNKVMDKYNVSANVSSLGGKFKIREGNRAMTEKDWEGLAEENVGSMVAPVPRRRAWISEKESYEYLKSPEEE